MLAYLYEFFTKLHPLTSQTYEQPSDRRRSNPQTWKCEKNVEEITTSLHEIRKYHYKGLRPCKT